MNPEKRIIDFIKKHHVLTLATSFNNVPYCANCFYSYLENENAFVFTSDLETRHISEAIKQPVVAGTVVLETSIIGKIQGIQFTGKLVKADGELHQMATKSYIQRFPFAILMNTTLWILYLEYIKLTDNRLGFGKKMIWEKNKAS